LVADSLAAMDKRLVPNPAALASLMGRGPGGWHGLLAGERHGQARAALGALIERSA
jgi:hypothetical protein